MIYMETITAEMSKSRWELYEPEFKISYWVQWLRMSYKVKGVQWHELIEINLN